MVSQTEAANLEIMSHLDDAGFREAQKQLDVLKGTAKAAQKELDEGYKRVHGGQVLVHRGQKELIDGQRELSGATGFMITKTMAGLALLAETAVESIGFIHDAAREYEQTQASINVTGQTIKNLGLTGRISLAGMKKDAADLSQQYDVSIDSIMAANGILVKGLPASQQQMKQMAELAINMSENVAEIPENASKLERAMTSGGRAIAVMKHEGIQLSPWMEHWIMQLDQAAMYGEITRIMIDQLTIATHGNRKAVLAAMGATEKMNVSYHKFRDEVGRTYAPTMDSLSRLTTRAFNEATKAVEKYRTEGFVGLGDFISSELNRKVVPAIVDFAELSGKELEEAGKANLTHYWKGLMGVSPEVLAWAGDFFENLQADLTGKRSESQHRSDVEQARRGIPSFLNRGTRVGISARQAMEDLRATQTPGPFQAGGQHPLTGVPPIQQPVGGPIGPNWPGYERRMRRSDVGGIPGLTASGALELRQKIDANQLRLLRYNLLKGGSGSNDLGGSAGRDELRGYAGKDVLVDTTKSVDGFKRQTGDATLQLEYFTRTMTRLNDMFKGLDNLPGFGGMVGGGVGAGGLDSGAYTGYAPGKGTGPGGAGGIRRHAGTGGREIGAYGGGSGPTRRARGSLAKNQQEAYAEFRRLGYSDKAARIEVGMISGESLRDPTDTHPDPSRSNPYQLAHGIASWDDVRSKLIKDKYGKSPEQLPLRTQIQALDWEQKTFYKRAYEDIRNERLSEGQRMYSGVKRFESPASPEADTATRLGLMHGMDVHEEAPVVAKSPDVKPPSVERPPSADAFKRPPPKKPIQDRIEQVVQIERLPDVRRSRNLNPAAAAAQESPAAIAARDQQMKEQRDINLGKGRISVDLNVPPHVQVGRPTIDHGENFDIMFGANRRLSQDKTGSAFARPGDPTYAGASVL